MTMQELISQLTGQYGMNLDQTNATLWLTLPRGIHQLRISSCFGGIDVGLYQQGAGEYRGTLLLLFELTLTPDPDAWQPAEIRWTPAFWQDEGVAVDYHWFVQHCADHLVASGWLTKAQIIAEEEIP